MKQAFLFAGFLAALALPPLAEACRFNVRDVGFVDFKQETYIAYSLVDKNTTKDQRDALEQIGFAALLESNIQSEVMDIADAPETIRKQVEAQSINTFPAILLSSPEGDSLHISIPESNDDFRDNVWDAMESLASSPLRETMIDTALERYGLVLLIEGPYEAANQRARAETDAAIKKIEDSMSTLPKEIKEPPVLISLSHEKAREEVTLLWSLGMDADKITEPGAAVIYGRGRMIGEMLKGDAINESNVHQILSVVGLSCECGLDRDWMMGVQFPLRWDSSRQEQVVASLGFDAESPLVKTEISQIMAIGQQNAAAGSGTTRSIGPNAMMSYTEMSVQAAPVEPPDEPQVVEESSDREGDLSKASDLLKTSQAESAEIARVNVPSAPEADPQATASPTALILIAVLGGGALVALTGGVIIFMRSRSRSA